MAFGDDAGGFGGFGDFAGRFDGSSDFQNPFLSPAGSPWDFGTGFDARPKGFGVGQAAPVMPQTDLAQNFAGALAQQGIRPGQFMANPAIAAPVLAPPTSPTLSSNWDPTPVATPGGPPVSLPGQPAPSSVGGGPQAPVQTGAGVGSPPDAGAEPAAPAAAAASAAASPADKAAAEKTMAQRITEGLKGVRPPTPPAVQTIRSPALPQHGALKQGQLLALLSTLGGTGPQAAGLKLPPTLGASLKGLY